MIHQPPAWLRIVAFVKYCNNSSLFSVQLREQVINNQNKRKVERIL